jgi:hypothetical protein
VGDVDLWLAELERNLGDFRRVITLKVSTEYTIS